MTRPDQTSVYVPARHAVAPVAAPQAYERRPNVTLLAMRLKTDGGLSSDRAEHAAKMARDFPGLALGVIAILLPHPDHDERTRQATALLQEAGFLPAEG